MFYGDYYQQYDSRPHATDDNEHDRAAFRILYQYTGVVVHVVTEYGTSRINRTKMIRNTTAQRVYPPNAP